MARQNLSSKDKAQADNQRRQLRRNQIVFSILAGVLIISMVLSLVVNL